MKYYLAAENERNAAGHLIFEKLLRLAFGSEQQVISGHHFMLAPDGKIELGVNEIPSADTAIFDHLIMKRVFGDKAINVMIACARKPVEERDAELKSWLNTIPDPPAPAMGILEEPDVAVEGDYPEAGGY